MSIWWPILALVIAGLVVGHLKAWQDINGRPLGRRKHGS